jgi:hypothetical protein
MLGSQRLFFSPECVENTKASPVVNLHSENDLAQFRSDSRGFSGMPTHRQTCGANKTRRPLRFLLASLLWRKDIR